MYMCGGSNVIYSVVKKWFILWVIKDCVFKFRLSVCVYLLSFSLTLCLSLAHTNTLVRFHSLALSVSLPPLPLTTGLSSWRSICIPSCQCCWRLQAGCHCCWSICQNKKTIQSTYRRDGRSTGNKLFIYVSILFVYFWFNYIESCLYEYEHSMLVLIKIGDRKSVV